MRSLLLLTLALFALCAPFGKEGRMIAAHHTMMVSGSPSKLSFFCIKFVAARFLRNCASLSALNSHDGTMAQLSEVQFIDMNNARYVLPTDATFSAYTAYNGERHYSEPKLISGYASGEQIGQMFDGNTSTKWGPYRYFGHRPIFDFYTGEPLMVDGESYDDAFYQSHFGYKSMCFGPVAIVVDVSSKPIDLSEFSRWQLLNANDNATQTNRTIVEAEILGSGDGKSWWRLDIFNNPNATNVNYATVRLGNLIPRKGDIWSDLDLSTRDWTNGIAVDNI